MQDADHNQGGAIKPSAQSSVRKHISNLTAVCTIKQWQDAAATPQRWRSWFMQVDAGRTTEHCTMRSEWLSSCVQQQGIGGFRAGHRKSICCASQYLLSAAQRGLILSCHLLCGRGIARVLEDTLISYAERAIRPCGLLPKMYSKTRCDYKRLHLWPAYPLYWVWAPCV
jgi:hypothetical protein